MPKIATLLERKQALLERKQEEPDLEQVAELERVERLSGPRTSA